MKLKDFVSDTLIQIAEAVTTAQPRYEQLGGKVIPFVDCITNSYQATVEFDIIITEEDSQVAALLDTGVIKELTFADKPKDKISRVRFSVPVSLPEWREPREQE